MKKFFATVIIIGVYAFVNSVFAFQPNKTATIYGAGMASCGKYVEARQSNRSGEIYQFSAWIDGFLTAFTMYNPDAHPDYINSKKDDEALLLWLDNYCKEKPLDNFHLAVQSLVKELNASKKKGKK